MQALSVHEIGISSAGSKDMRVSVISFGAWAAAGDSTDAHRDKF